MGIDVQYIPSQWDTPINGNHTIPALEYKWLVFDNVETLYRNLKSMSNMDSGEALCNGSQKTGKGDHSKHTLSHNTGKNGCKPLSYCSTLGSRIENALEFFGSYVQSHDQAMGVGNCSPGTPLLLVFPMPRAKTKYQRNQEIANFRLDAKTRFLAAAKDPNWKKIYPPWSRLQACQKALPITTWQVDWQKLSPTSPTLGSALKKRKQWMNCCIGSSRLWWSGKNR